MEDTALKLGLLMEAAQAQQALAASALERLREHTAGLDAIVREEIRATILEELQSLGADSQRAAAGLRSLQRAADLRIALWSTAILSLSALVPIGVVRWLSPSRSEIAALGARRDELAFNIARLTQEGGRLELRHCGTAQRLCIRVDRAAPSYGERSDFLVVKGY